MPVLRTLLVIFAVLPLVDRVGVADDAQEEKVTLLGMLHEWEYPGFKFHGATMSHAAVQGD